MLSDETAWDTPQKPAAPWAGEPWEAGEEENYGPVRALLLRMPHARSLPLLLASWPTFLPVALPITAVPYAGDH